MILNPHSNYYMCDLHVGCLKEEEESEEKEDEDEKKDEEKKVVDEKKEDEQENKPVTASILVYPLGLFPTLDAYNYPPKKPVAFKVHTTIDKRVDALMTERYV